jgi:hypothetical protein
MKECDDGPTRGEHCLGSGGLSAPYRAIFSGPVSLPQTDLLAFNVPWKRTWSSDPKRLSALPYPGMVFSCRTRTVGPSWLID